MRTTFRRQMMIILCLLLIPAVLVGGLFWYFCNDYIEQQQTRSLKNCAQTVVNLVQAYSDGLQDWEFRTNLSVAAASSEKDVLVCSPDGRVLICARELQNCAHIDRELDAESLKIILQGSDHTKLRLRSIYDEDRFACGMPLKDDAGEVSYIILVSVARSELDGLSGHILSIFLMTTVVVMALSVLVAPFFTHRETKPIRTMAIAARQIAHGNFDVRVPTGNRAAEIEDLAVAFNNMSLALRNSETARQEFVANVSHELKTPMTTIAGYLDGMLDGTIPQEKHREYMQLVSSEARRLSRMVRNMLEVSRLRDQGIPPQDMRDFDVCEMAGQALLSFEQRILRKNLNVEVDMPEEGLRVHALPDSVTQVLYNLLDNAVKFVNEAGTLSVCVRRQGNSALVSVGNTGATIAPEELPLIFDRFHKTDKSRSTDRDGVGLGLYIVKTLIMAHGEDIYVTSRDGKTEFTFTLSLPKRKEG